MKISKTTTAWNRGVVALMVVSLMGSLPVLGRSSEPHHSSISPTFSCLFASQAVTPPASWFTLSLFEISGVSPRQVGHDLIEQKNREQLVGIAGLAYATRQWWVYRLGSLLIRLRFREQGKSLQDYALLTLAPELESEPFMIVLEALLEVLPCVSVSEDVKEFCHTILKGRLPEDRENRIPTARIGGEQKMLWMHRGSILASIGIRNNRSGGYNTKVIEAFYWMLYSIVMVTVQKFIETGGDIKAAEEVGIKMIIESHSTYNQLFLNGEVPIAAIAAQSSPERAPELTSIVVPHKEIFEVYVEAKIDEAVHGIETHTTSQELDVDIKVLRFFAKGGELNLTERRWKIIHSKIQNYKQQPELADKLISLFFFCSPSEEILNLLFQLAQECEVPSIQRTATEALLQIRYAYPHTEASERIQTFIEHWQSLILDTNRSPEPQLLLMLIRARLDGFIDFSDEDLQQALHRVDHTTFPTANALEDDQEWEAYAVMHFDHAHERFLRRVRRLVRHRKAAAMLFAAIGAHIRTTFYNDDEPDIEASRILWEEGLEGHLHELLERYSITARPSAAQQEELDRFAGAALGGLMVFSDKATSGWNDLRTRAQPTLRRLARASPSVFPLTVPRDSLYEGSNIGNEEVDQLGKANPGFSAWQLWTGAPQATSYIRLRYRTPTPEVEKVYYVLRGLRATDFIAAPNIQLFLLKRIERLFPQASDQLSIWDATPSPSPALGTAG